MEEEIIEDLAKIRSQAQAEDKESQIGSYSLKRKGRSGDDKARQAKEGQVKLNGLCINCPLTGKLLHLIEARMISFMCNCMYIYSWAQPEC